VRLGLTPLIISLALWVCACGNIGAPPDGGDLATRSVVVPDVTGNDGQDAVDTIETAGLTTSLEGNSDEPSFDPARDPTGCTVEDQTPAGGERAQRDDDVTLTLDCREVDWENQEGDDWDNYNTSFEQGFADGCQALFDLSPDGNLYDSGTQYTVDDCSTQDPGDGSDAAPADLPDDAEQQGYDDGFAAACQAAFDSAGVDTLYYGHDSYTVDDCLAQNAPAPSATSPKRPNPAPTPPARPPSSVRGSVAPAGHSCMRAQSTGGAIVVHATVGTVHCSGAAALWAEYVSRAPQEGAGSHGDLKLEGWECIAAAPPEKPLLGRCDKQDGSASFEVREK
jgi:hypothetical protein